MAPFSMTLSCFLYSKSCNWIPLCYQAACLKRSKEANSLDHSVCVTLLRIISPLFVSRLHFINSNTKFISRLFLEEKLYFIGFSSDIYLILPKPAPSKIPPIVWDVNYASKARVVHIMLYQFCVCVPVFLITGFAETIQILNRNLIFMSWMYNLMKKKLNFFTRLIFLLHGFDWH